ncbi:MAG: RNB domain-containing ribonuclease, partial [Bacteroidota bacterium]
MKTKGKKLNRHQLQSEIVRLFQRHPKKRYSAKQIIKKLKIANNKDAVTAVLDKLVKYEKIRPVAEYKYRLSRTGSGEERSNSPHKPATGRSYYEGKVDMTRSGAAYIIVDELDHDVHISPKNTNNALNGDMVKISAWTPRGRNKPEGEVIEVLQRATEHFIGTVQRSKNYAFVIPDKERMPTDIYVDLNNLKGARDKEKVVVKIVKWPAKNGNSPEGIVTAVLGAVGSSDIEMKSILISNGFDLEHNPKALRQANAISEEIKIEEIAKRRDFRPITTFTIDPLTAKDFDDALSIEYLPDGEFEIGVHIADVTHYVKPNTSLDKEAFERSTSVYLVDRVLPMLPEKLSNVLCSLRPDEDKLTFSVAFRFNKKNKLINTWIGKTIIHSDRRFTYGEAQQVIDTKTGDFVKEVNDMNDVAVGLRAERFKNGSIDFDADEVKFILNE